MTSQLDELIIHPASKKILIRLRQNLPQSLLVSGPAGIGLRTIVWQLGQVAGELSPQDAKQQPDLENGTITVEMIRRLYEQTRTKQSTRQVVIIDNADRMSRGAQSAFLKLLEEPGDSTTFILTSHQPDTLLPTIRSRVQHLSLQPATPEQSEVLIVSLGITDATKKAQLQYLAGGLPAELIRLNQDQERFARLASTINDARELLQGSAYQKVLVIQKYKNSRAATLQLVDSAIAILRRSISARPQQTLLLQLERLLTIREHIAANYNVGLQLMQFVL